MPACDHGICFCFQFDLFAYAFGALSCSFAYLWWCCCCYGGGGGGGGGVVVVVVVVVVGYCCFLPFNFCLLLAAFS